MSWNEFLRFGEPGAFAIDVSFLPDPDAAERAPADSIGSWAQWRLWVGGINLTRLQIVTADGAAPVVDGVTWYLAPLLRWLVANWTPLLHETRLPAAVWRASGPAPRWARAAYLSMIETAGDDPERFDVWQAWAGRHALRSAAEGGILPDIFFQRIDDEIELSWGDRIDPGAEAVTFLTEDGVMRTPVATLAGTLANMIDALLIHPEICDRPWSAPISAAWQAIRAGGHDAALAWYLDARPAAGTLTRKVLAACRRHHVPIVANDNEPWIDQLAPAVAMFGDVSPQISAEAAALLVAEFVAAKAARHEGDDLEADRLAEDDDPAWAASSPWDSGYALAMDVLDQADPAEQSGKTQVEQLLMNLGVRISRVALGEHGPRGVALAGKDIAPTIVVNVDHIANTGFGLRFTLAHELCHILFDRGRAATLAHSSTPWAPVSVEQRANAFAAMLLMPRHRARLDHGVNIAALKGQVDRLAAILGVSRSALRHHLANIGEITPYQFALLADAGTRNLH